MKSTTNHADYMQTIRTKRTLHKTTMSLSQSIKIIYTLLQMTVKSNNANITLNISKPARRQMI